MHTVHTYIIYIYIYTHVHAYMHEYINTHKEDGIYFLLTRSIFITQTWLQQQLL